MDRLDRSEPREVGRQVWHRFCPRCLAPTCAHLAAVRGPYELLVRRLLHKQKLECSVCGLRLRGLASLDRGRPIREVEGPARFMKPVDGRASTDLLRELKRAETERELGAPASPVTRVRSHGPVDG